MIIIDHFAKLSVNVNGLIVPGISVENVLARHAINLVVYNEGDEKLKVWLPGSATAVRYRGLNLLLVTQHQLKGFDASQVSMMTDDGHRVVTSTGMRCYPQSQKTDANEIVAFNFTEPVAAVPELAPRFFNLTERPTDIFSDLTLAMLLVGFPSDVQDYDLYDNNRLGFRRFHVACMPHEDQPSDDALLRVKPTQPLQIDPNGMSGGTAFAVQYTESGPRAYFAGLICRGGRDDLYVIKADVVFAFLDSILPWSTTARCSA